MYYHHIQTFEYIHMNLDVFSIQADLYNALANPKRLEIIHLLRHKELSVTEMVEMLGLPQSNLSQHLTILRKSNVVTTRREGKNIYYTLSHKNIISIVIASFLIVSVGVFAASKAGTPAAVVESRDLRGELSETEYAWGE